MNNETPHTPSWQRLPAKSRGRVDGSAWSSHQRLGGQGIAKGS